MHDESLTMEFDNRKLTDGNFTKDNPKIEKSCGLILFRETSYGREFLLLKYPEGHWDMPKGHMEEGETEEETALRECEEETGIQGVELIEGFRQPLSYQFYANFPNLKGWIKKTVVFFVGKAPSGADTTLSHEHHDFEWLDEPKMRSRISFENTRIIFDNVITFLDDLV